MADYEDYRTFKMVSVLQNGRAVGITSAYDAAKCMLEQWQDDGGPKASTAKAILLKCLAGDCSPAIARVGFVEAAREAGIFIETTPQEQGLMVVYSGLTDKTQTERKLIDIYDSDGNELGQKLLKEGFARPWLPKQKIDWCA
jgi:Protein of unknown function (DUF982)